VLGARSGSSSAGNGAWPSSDGELIQGVLGAGGLALALQPAGPGAGHLPGVAAAYRAAALVAADSGRAFQGEIDLALELAMLQSLQEHRQQQQEGTGSGGEHRGQRARAGGEAAPGVATAAGAPSAAASGSFDIDELLTWSTTNA
jgi:hypothetical protein